MKITTIVLAAGKGTRMQSQLPKVLHKIADKSLLRHVFDTSTQIANNTVHIIVGHQAALVRASMQDLPINWIEQSQQLGTGHAVQQATDFIGNDDVVLVLFGDVPLIKESTIKTLISNVNDDSLALLTVNLNKPYGYGRIVRNALGNVTSIVEEKDATESQNLITEVNTGIMAVLGKDLKTWLSRLSNNNAQAEYYLTDVIAMAVLEGKTIVTSQPINADEVLGVNDRIQLAYLERAYQQIQVEELMEQGVSFRDPKRFDLRGRLVSLGQDIDIDVNVIMEGMISIGNNVKIGANSIIKNAKIADNVEIFANCIIEDAVIGEFCRIGPYARLRPETTLSDNVHIGNFVELKKASIASASKINHLSYIGDAEVGSKVNIGAGTITCNYDGVNKFKTIIGDGAFIGSDSQLIAPVTIGKNATIGAGTTVTKNTPDDQLTLSRVKQITVPGWQRPTKQGN